MANLLDQASIVLTPTAYDDGKVLCAKPSEAPYGDFDFSRNSAATRVNAQGLVENVQILSSNLVQNGDFSDLGAQEVKNGSFARQSTEKITNGDFSNGINNWSTGSSNPATVSNEVLTLPNSAYIFQGLTSMGGKQGKIVVNGSGKVRYRLDVGSYSAPTEMPFTIYEEFPTSITRLQFQNTSGEDVTIDNVSVVEVGQFWTLTGWSVGENKAISDGSGSVPNTDLVQSSVFTSGVTYKISLQIEDFVSGNLQLQNNTTNFPQSNGTHTIYYTAGSGQSLILRSLSFIGSITNISVKEVGQDWDFGTGFSIGDNVAVAVSGTASKLQQTISGLSGKKCKVTFTLSNYGGSGIIKLDFGSTSGQNVSANGTYTEVGIYDIDRLEFFKNGSFNGSITNISVIEITDDTNLPRINYEGFSYKDILGSEEIVNGNFSNGSTDWSTQGNSDIEIGNFKGRKNVAKININNTSTGSRIAQPFNYVLGKSYKVEINVYVESGSFRADTVESYVPGDFVSTSDLGYWQTLTGYITATRNGVSDFWLRSISQIATFYVANVSVKEYSGQEVVPNSGCGSWLFEPQSTNLITYSSDFSDSSWIKSNMTVTPNSIISPDGTLNADELNGQYIYKNINVLGNTVYTFSFYVKNNSATNPEYAIYDLTNNSFIVGETSYLSEINNDTFVRVSVTFTTASNTLIIRPYPSRKANTTIYIWGAMLEENSYPTSLIPTEGSTVTRNQDVCNNGGSLATINSTEGTLYAEIAALTRINPSGNITLSDGTGNNRIYIYYLIDNSISVIYNVNSTGASINNFSLANITDQTKIAVRWGNSNVSVWINGTSVLSNTTSNFLPNTLNVLSFAKPAGSGNFYGKTKALAVWKEALSDQELVDLTYPAPTDPTFTLDFDTIAEQFTFARGSEATYVDAQGLIQSTNEIGEEEVTNGDYEQSGIGNAISQSGGVLVNENNQLKITSNGSSGFSRGVWNTNGSQGQQFLIKADIISVSGNTRFIDISTNTGQSLTAGTTFSTIITLGGSTPQVGFGGLNDTSFELVIDNVSIKQITTATNTPRLDYSTGAEAFLLEPQTTQLLTYSEDFSQWVPGGSTTIEGGYLAPDGTNNAYKVSGAGSALTLAASLLTTTTRSIYARTVSGTGQARLCSFNGNSNNLFTITEQWQRFEVNSAISTGVTSFYAVDFRGGTTLSEIILWGANATNDQDYATSYIPSNGSQTTRNQETCTNATPEINSEEGVLYAEISVLANDGTNRAIALSDGSTSNVVRFYYSVTDNRIVGNVKSGGTTYFNFNNVLSSATDFLKVAISYRLNNFKMYVNGTLVFTDTSGNTPIGLNELSFDNGAGNDKFFGNTKDLQVYTKALSDAELIKLTT